MERRIYFFHKNFIRFCFIFNQFNKFLSTKLPNFTVQLTKKKHHHPAPNKNTPKRRIQLQNYNSKVHQPNNHELKPSTTTPSTATQKCTHSTKSLMSSYGPLCNADGSLFPMPSGRPLPKLSGD